MIAAAITLMSKSQKTVAKPGKSSFSVRMLTLRTETDLLKAAALRVRQQRAALSLRQEDLAESSGVSLGTIRSFEKTGRIGFANLAKLLSSLGLIDSLVMAFEGRGHGAGVHRLPEMGGNFLPQQSMGAPSSIQDFMTTAHAPQRVRVKLRRAGEG